MRDGLKDLRDAVMRRLDLSHEPSSRMVTAIDGFINDAQDALALEAPFLFHEDVVRFRTRPDQEPASDQDLLVPFRADEFGGVTTFANPWVLKTALPVGEGTTWNTAREWDGRRIDIRDSNGNWHQNRIRSVWQREEEDGDHYYVSLWKPIPASLWLGNDTGFRWRVYDDATWLPDDIIKILSMHLVNEDAIFREVKVVSQRDAERNGATAMTSANRGEPRATWRCGRFSMPAPNTAPSVAEGDPNTHPWQGPEPAGTFVYCYTLCWGKREYDTNNPGLAYHFDVSAAGNSRVEPPDTTNVSWGQERYREPMWESPPSPVSDEITVKNVTENEGVYSKSGAVVLTLPAIEYQLGFGIQGDRGSATNTELLRYSRGHSGWYLRIWRKRVTEDFTNYDQLSTTAIGGRTIDGLSKLDLHDSFHLLAEVNIHNNNSFQFVDNGWILPDYNRRLRNVHGYQGIAFWPRPDTRYEIEARIVRRPPPLVSDNDAPPINPEAIEALIDKAVSLTAQMLKDPGREAASLKLYHDKINLLRRTYGDLRPEAQAIPLRFARVIQPVRTTEWWRNSSE